MDIVRCDHECSIVSHHNDSKAAWVISRDRKDSNELFADMDTPVSEFDRFTLRIVTNVLCREVITSLRNHIIWSRTSRVDSYESSLPICASVEFFNQNLDKFFSISNDIESKRLTLSQDIWRLNLPLGVRTEFAWNTDRRTLKVLINYLLDYETTRDLGNSMLKSLGNFINFKRSRNGSLLPKLTNFDPKKSQINDEFIRIDAEIPFALRAQLVRHRYISIVDNLDDFLKSEESLTKPLTTSLKVRVVAIPYFFNRIVSHRICWMAQTGLWAPLLSEYFRSNNAKKSLPCKGTGKCVFLGDQERRLKLDSEIDPNPPCPVYCLQNNIEVSHLTLERMKLHAADRPSIFRNEISRLRVV